MRRTSRWTIAVLTVAAPIAAPTLVDAQETDAEWLEDCREDRWGEDERYCEVRDVQLTATGSLTIDGGRNGGAWVRGESRSGVAATARIQAWGDSESDARATADRIRIRTEDGSLGADGPGGGSWSVSFRVIVPRDYDLRMEAINGPLAVEGVSGRIEMNTRNGPVSLYDAGGDVRARTQNGPLRVRLTGSRWTGAGLDAETRNGPVSLEIPDGFGAELETGTHNGPFRTDIPLQVTLQGNMGHSGAREIRTRLGEGGPRVRAVTTNGPVVIERR